jgi:hypothetical protein
MHVICLFHIAYRICSRKVMSILTPKRLAKKNPKTRGARVQYTTLSVDNQPRRGRLPPPD